ncbi:MAG: trypsin-like peptidase domain-containing protein, partial [Caldilineales bacterium]|nr:trypsin-like peptidase domain-containing protein [Caldilineales bacterium]
MSGSSSRLPWLLGGLVALLFLCFLVVMAGAVAVPWFLLSARQPAAATVAPAPRSETPPSAPQATPIPLPPLESGRDLETEINIRVYEFANPGVVAVRVLDEDIAEQLPDIQPFFFDTGEGSGFVLDEEGHIVTNRHVVLDARNVVVQFYDGIQAPATIVGTDRDSDLAVLKVDPEGLDLRPLPLGSMDDLKVGMRVLVIGNPFGNANTLTTGIVSALGRQIELPDSPFLLPEVIQTDAAINPGNS